MAGDKLLDLAVDVEVTADAQVIGETLDFGAGYNTGGYDVEYYGKVKSAITGNGVDIVGSDTEDFATSKVLVSKTLTPAEKLAGAAFAIGSLPKSGNCRYIRAISKGITAGTFSILSKTVKPLKASSVGEAAN